MPSIASVKRRALAAAVTGVLCAAAAIATPGAQGATTRSCKPIVNPYPGSRYAGVDLTRIRAIGVSCATARRVARRAHRKALGRPVPEGGIRRFIWNGWRVTGDLRSASDRYVARRGGNRVLWRF